jgi:hypothetical protein
MKSVFADLTTLAMNKYEKTIVKQEDVTHNGKTYWVSTALTADHGWETMIFLRGEDGEIDWTDLYSATYADRAAAEAGHAGIVADFASVPLRTDGGSSYYGKDWNGEDDWLN